MFPNRKENGKKPTSFFYIKDRKIFPTLLHRKVYPSLWWKMFQLYRFCCFWPIEKWKIPPFFSTVLPALARKLHPCYPLFHLLSSCRASNSVLFQSSFCFRIKVFSQEFEPEGVGEWQKEGNDVVFSSVFWNPVRSSKVLGRPAPMLLSCSVQPSLYEC